MNYVGQHLFFIFFLFVFTHKIVGVCALEYVYEYVHSYANCLHKFIGVCPHFFKIYSSLIYYIPPNSLSLSFSQIHFPSEKNSTPNMNQKNGIT